MILRELVQGALHGPQRAKGIGWEKEKKRGKKKKLKLKDREEKKGCEYVLL